MPSFWTWTKIGMQYRIEYRTLADRSRQNAVESVCCARFGASAAGDSYGKVEIGIHRADKSCIDVV